MSVTVTEPLTLAGVSAALLDVQNRQAPLRNPTVCTALTLEGVNSAIKRAADVIGRANRVVYVRNLTAQAVGAAILALEG